MSDCSSESPRGLEFIGSSRADLSSFPERVKDVTGFALWQIQSGRQHADAKFMKGHLREVIEISVGDAVGERTYRTTCDAKFGDVVYVLHAFQKKSPSGVATAKRDLDLIERRLEAARRHHRGTV